MKKAFCFLLILVLLLGVSVSCFADTSPIAMTSDGPKPVAAPEEAPDVLPPSPRSVENGEVIIAPDYEGVCEIRVFVDADTDLYVYLEYLGESEKSVTGRELKADARAPYESDLAFYVKAGETVKMKIPVGIYQLYYAIGTVFYGEEELFGDETNCFSADDLMEFYINEKGHYIQYSVKYHQLTPYDFMTGIPQEDFPGAVHD